MMRAVLLHGTDNTPADNWYPWAIKQLELLGYEVFAPNLPDNHTPNRDTYSQFLHESNWDFSENIIIGHSSGATTVINLLLSDWFPKIKTAVLVGVFLNENIVKSAAWYDPGQFDNLFPKNVDIKKLKEKCHEFIMIHGDNDPYCDFNDAKYLGDKLGAKLIVVNNGGHLTKNSGYLELPHLFEGLGEV